MYRFITEETALSTDSGVCGMQHGNIGTTPGSPLTRAMQYIDSHILEDLSLKTVSAQVHVSPSHLIRLFREETGQTYLKYVTRQKMEKAAELLKSNRGLKIYEAAHMLGYCSERHFSKVFFHYYGCYPSAYRSAAVAFPPHSGKR